MKQAGEGAARYPIRAVSRLTGIGIDTLRAWERRYGAVTPTRDDRGRLYTDADVARLRLLHDAVGAGHNIGQIAGLSTSALTRLATAHRAAAPTEAPPRTRVDTQLLTDALTRLDNVTIDQEFSRLAALLPPFELVRDVLLPSLREVGANWNKKRGGIAHEHLISATMRHLLGSFLRMYARRESKIRVLFATPAGDRHELGILVSAMLAASSGLGVSYVGPDLPAAEIIEAVKSAGARVLVLGVTVADGIRQERELRAVVRDLPPRVELWAGGPAAQKYAAILSARGGLALGSFEDYVHQLERLARRTR